MMAGERVVSTSPSTSLPWPPRPRVSQRVAALGAILLAAVVVVATIASTLADLRRLAVLIPLIVVALAAGWYAITRNRRAAPSRSDCARGDGFRLRGRGLHRGRS